MVDFLLSSTNDTPVSLWIIELIIIGLFGLILGSFSSAMIYRIPRKISWVASKERSKCTSCKEILRTRDLIPLFSWLFNQGKCRHCKAAISSFYPILEIISAIMCMMVFLLHKGIPLEQYIVMSAVPFLLALVVIDLQHKILPNQLTAILAAIGAVYIGVRILIAPDLSIILWSHLGGAALFGALALTLAFAMKRLLHKEALGMGDIKFFAVAGLWLGAPHIGLFCMLSGLLGVGLGVIWKYKFKESTFPFGPALIASFFLILLLDGSILLEKTLHYLKL